MRASIACQFLVVFALGCGGESYSEGDVEPSPSGFDVKEEINQVDQVFASHDAAEADLRLSTEEVAAKISSTGNWTPVTLTEIGIGQYEATAFTKDDREFAMEVRQDANGIYWRWRNEDGSSGGSAMTTW